MCAPDDDDEPPVGLACALNGFTHAAYVRETIALLGKEDISLSEGSKFAQIYEKFKNVIDQYQEQPHLLDRDLPSILQLSLDILAKNPADGDRFHGVCRLLFVLIKTRGYKVVRTLLPHEVVDVEVVLSYVAAQNVLDISNWETHSVLLLWLSILATVPFALERFDAGPSDSDKPHQNSLVNRFLDVCLTYIQSRSKCAAIAAYTTACFLSRPDVHGVFLKPYLDRVAKQLVNSNSEDSGSDVGAEFTRVSLLLAVCGIFKMAKHEVLRLHSAATLSNIVLVCANSDAELERKLAYKLVQRIGLCQLPANLAPWRYLMKRRTLLGRAAGVTSDAGDGGETIVATDAASGDVNVDVPDMVEDIIDLLLTGLGDRSARARWSAAKGLGRLASRLPEAFASDVVHSVFDLFVERDREKRWQGGCLALAEFGRRGVLLPCHLKAVALVLDDALVYDEYRGSCSVGSAVRDTACYAAWTLGRSYDPAVIEPFVTPLAGQLLCVASFDREVNVRRAASAAFQECVGRLGNFPNGIELVRSADYFAVGRRSRAFLEVGVTVAKYPEYTRRVVDHLIVLKVPHWDKAIRELAAATLAALVPFDVSYFTEEDSCTRSVCGSLLELAASFDSNFRLGGLLALGRVTVAIDALGVTLPAAVVERMLNLISDHKRRLNAAGSLSSSSSSSLHYQTFGALADLIGDLSRSRTATASVTVDERTLVGEWWPVGEACLDNPDASIQSQGVAALAAIIQHRLRALDDVSALTPTATSTLASVSSATGSEITPPCEAGVRVHGQLQQRKVVNRESRVSCRLAQICSELESGGSVDRRAGHAKLLGSLDSDTAVCHALTLLKPLFAATRSVGWQLVNVRREALIAASRICLALAVVNHPTCSSCFPASAAAATAADSTKDGTTALTATDASACNGTHAGLDNLQPTGLLSATILDELFLCIRTSLADFSLSETFFDVGLRLRTTAMTVFYEVMLNVPTIADKITVTTQAEAAGLAATETAGCGAVATTNTSLQPLQSVAADAPSSSVTARRSSGSSFTADLVLSIVQMLVGCLGDAQRASADAASTALRALLRLPNTASFAGILGDVDALLRWQTLTADGDDSGDDGLSALLASPVYQADLVATLLVAMGARTEKESMRAQIAVLKYLHGVQDDRESLRSFSSKLASVVQRPFFQKNRFLFPSVIRGVGRLLNTGALANGFSEPMSAMADFIWQHVRRSKDVNKILSSIETFCEMLQFDELCISSLKRLSLFLGSMHFPQVRMQTARKLYETLLMYSAVIPEENYEVALALLSDTNWLSNDLEEIRNVRNHFCDLASVPKPISAPKKE